MNAVGASRDVGAVGDDGGNGVDGSITHLGVQSTHEKGGRHPRRTGAMACPVSVQQVGRGLVRSRKSRKANLGSPHEGWSFLSRASRHLAVSVIERSIFRSAGGLWTSSGSTGAAHLYVTLRNDLGLCDDARKLCRAVPA